MKVFSYILVLFSAFFAAFTGVVAHREVGTVPIKGTDHEKALACLSFYHPLKKFWKQWQKHTGPHGTKDFYWDTLGCLPLTRDGDWTKSFELFVSCARWDFSIKNWQRQGRLTKKILKLIERQFKFDLSAQCWIDKHSKKKCRKLARAYRRRAHALDAFLVLNDADSESKHHNVRSGTGGGGAAAVAGAVVRADSLNATLVPELPLQLGDVNQLVWNASWWNGTRWAEDAEDDVNGEEDEMPELSVGMMGEWEEDLGLYKRKSFCSG